MNHRLKVGTEIKEIAVEGPREDGAYRVTVGPKVRQVHSKAVGPGCFFMVVDGKTSRVWVLRTERGKEIFAKGCTFLVEDADRHEARSGAGAYERTAEEITPPTPSVVVRILVSEGDRVKKGQGLIVLSAMKMETTLSAPWNARVEKINTSLDARVAPGDILVELGKEDPEDDA